MVNSTARSGWCLPSPLSETSLSAAGEGEMIKVPPSYEGGQWGQRVTIIYFIVSTNPKEKDGRRKTGSFFFFLLSTYCHLYVSKNLPF